MGPSEERLPVISSATLTLIDIGVDASEKIAHILGPSHLVDSIFGFFSLGQIFLSSFCFAQTMSPFHVASGVLQTYGYLVICVAAGDHSLASVSRGQHPLFGSWAPTVGLFFAIVALLLRCLSTTMTEALGYNVKLTVGELCRGNGFVGITIIIVYHGLLLATKTEKIVLLVAVKETAVIAMCFTIAAAFQQYAGFWLVLRTRAVEYARVVMFASLAFFAIRHMVYREDGAAYGFYQFPTIGTLMTAIGFILITLAPPTGADLQIRSGFELLGPSHL
jgi:hypothetical protein